MIDQATGEVRDDAEVGLVPLHIAELDEDYLLSLFPTPVQCAGALLIARERLANAPGALNDLARAVRDAKRDFTVERGKAFQRARSEGLSIADANAWRDVDEKVSAAREAVDAAELALEYGRETRRTLESEIEILRSLNANMRTEHRHG